MNLVKKAMMHIARNISDVIFMTGGVSLLLYVKKAHDYYDVPIILVISFIFSVIIEGLIGIFKK